MGEINIRHISLEGIKNISADATLQRENNSNTIKFTNDEFEFSIVSNDSVDLDDFYNLLMKKEKRISLKCILQKKDKTYKGTKKLVWKDNRIAISQGGIRLEFEDEAVEMLTEVIQSLKS
ncbi:hypothetical protein JXC34_00025 [Candidatus Woesearchaeota archaeon]|nr:hypothetical protein [Candidatus Woesearchaeota archaeon]